MKKENKIFVAVSPDCDTRRKILAKLAVQVGLARIPSDAMKIIAEDIPDTELNAAYFILCASYNFRGATITNQRLYELAARGIFVAVGVKALPREYQFLCRAYYPEDFAL